MAKPRWLKGVLVGVLAASVVANVALLSCIVREPESNPAYVEYRPVFFDVTGPGRVEDGYFVDRRALSEGHLEKVRVVLEHEGIEYRDANGGILIPREVWEDTKQVWGITLHAMNWYWLRLYADYDGDRRGTWEDLAALRARERMSQAGGEN